MDETAFVSHDDRLGAVAPISAIAMPIAITPVDALSITTLVDNNVDVLMPDAGFVRRWGPVGT